MVFLAALLLPGGRFVRPQLFARPEIQQLYGGGAGYTFVKTPKQELDLKFDIHYERQQYFITPNVVPIPPLTPSKNLIGADFGDTYM